MDRKNDPKISIIMPIYNAEKYLHAAVDSILSQTFSDFELILVDDGSMDSSPAICDAYAEQDPRVIALHQPNGGICDARNAGLSAAKGQYVGFMDNDDILESTALEENYDLAIKHDADWVKFGKTELLVQDEHTLIAKPTRFCFGVYDHSQLMEAFMKLRNDAAMTFVWDSLFRRSILEDHCLRFDTTFKHGNEDIDLCERFAAYCNIMVVNPKSYYIHYTRIGVSTSSKYSDAAIQSHLYLLEKSNARYQDYGINTPPTDKYYASIVTKQLVVSSCQKLNDAGKLLRTNDKLGTLQAIYSNSIMERYLRCDANLLWQLSVKLYLYCMLFQKKHFRTLLLLDKYSRKLVYWFRMQKTK